jgi:hypothetical protein
MQLRLFTLALGSLFATTACTDDPEDVVVEDPPTEGPPRCVSEDQRATKTVEVRGTVVDFATGAPVANAVVDITTGWDVEGNFPHGACPLIASARTAADGTFGPLTVAAGSPQDPPILVFLVRGAGRAQTADDNRATCTGATCTLDHTIPVPSIDTARAWRKELAAGGMSDALTRGLVLFKFKESDGRTGAAGVGPRVLSPDGSEPIERGLIPGEQLRFLEADRATLAPSTQLTTTASGIAVIGMDPVGGLIRVTGERGPGDAWVSTGCLVQNDWIFFEDRSRAQL